MKKKSPNPNQKNSSVVQTIDLIGSKFSLGFSSTTGAFQTRLGGYLTVLLGMVSMVVLVNIMYQYFDTESPIVTTSTELNARDHVFNLYEEDLYLMLAISNAFGFIEDYKRFITPKLRVYNLKYNPIRKAYEIEKIKEFDYVNCDKITDPKMKQILDVTHSNKDIQRMSLCPDFAGSEDEFSISDDLDTNTYRRAELTLYPCSLEDQTKCAKPQEFLLFRAYYGQMNKLLTSANFEKPVTLSPTIGDITLNLHFSKFMKFAVNNNRVIDSKYEFFAQKIKEEYLNFEVIERDINPRNPSQLHCTERQVDLWKRGGCLEYLSIVYEVKREVFIVRRNYKRISDVFCQFGGIMKLLTGVVFFFYSWYNKSKIKSSIIAATFDLDENEKTQVTHFLNYIEKGDKKGQETRRKVPRTEKPKSKSNLAQHLNISYSNLKGLQSERIEKKGKKQRNRRPRRNQILTKPPENGECQKVDSQVKNILSQLAKKRTNADDLINKLNFIEFLQMLFLDKNLKKLLPMLLIKNKYKKEHGGEEINKNAARAEVKEEVVIEEEPSVDIGKTSLEEAAVVRNGIWGQKNLHKHKKSNLNSSDEEVGNQKPRIQVFPPIDQRPSLKRKSNINRRRDQDSRRVVISSRRNQTRGGKEGQEPKSLKSAFYALKSSQTDNCQLKESIKKFVIQQIGDFFDQKQEETSPVRNEDESSCRLIKARSEQREPSETPIKMKMRPSSGLDPERRFKKNGFNQRKNRRMSSRPQLPNKVFKRGKRRHKTGVMILGTRKKKMRSFQNFLD